MKASFLAVAASMALTAGSARAAPDTPLHAALGASDAWTINGSVRVRLEGIDNQFRPAPTAGSDAFLSFRTTLFAEYDAGPIRIGGELFDSRGYGQKDNSSAGTTEVNALELGQAYLGVDLGDGLGRDTASTLTAGRFTMDAGSRRLVARNQFRNTINAFTGLRLDWQDRRGDKLLMFWTMPHTRLPTAPERIRDNDVAWDRESTDLQFYGASLTRTGLFGGTVELYGYGLSERDSPRYQTRDRHLFTPGLRLARAPKPGRFDYDVEAVYQTGHERGSTLPADRRDLDVSAYFLHLEVGHSFDGPWSPRLALQYDRVSGDGPDPDRYTRFDTLFGARRGEYGPTSLYGAVARANLSSPAVRLEVRPDARWDGLVAWRPLWLENAADSFSGTNVRDASGRSGTFAGHQVEARARYWVVPKIARLDSGVVWLIKGRMLEDAPNAPDEGDTRYAYVDLTLTF